MTRDDDTGAFGKQFYADTYYANVPFDENIVADYRTHWARLGHLFRLPADARVLDAGCGLGYWSMELQNHVAHLDAFDIAPAAVEAVRERVPRGRVWVGDVEHIEAPDAHYDGAFAFEVLEHLADSRTGLRELRRVLKDGGRLVLLQEYRGDDYARMIRAAGDLLDRTGLRKRKVARHADRRDLHRSARTPWGWAALLREEGFTVERRIVLSVIPTLVLPLSRALRRRYFSLPVLTPIDRFLCALPGAAWFGVGCIFIATKAGKGPAS